MNDDSLNARIDDLEIKVTLLEQANEELSQVLIQQQTSLETLSLKLEQAQAAVDNLGEMIGKDEGPPPHY